MPILVIANRNYSSWSLRAWLAIRHAGIAFDEIAVDLADPDSRAEILRHSPSGKVPALREGSLVVWESLAICEYVAEQNPAMWPAENRARSIARSVSAEMHAGFAALRSAMPMNLRATGRQVEITPEIAADIERIERIWSDCRGRFGYGSGPWLFGEWSLADAMFAPVATRFVTYGIHRPGVVDDYIATVFADPAFQEWRSGALAETSCVASSEVGEQGSLPPAAKSARRAKSGKTPAGD